MNSNHDYIAVFDSGVGGISVLRHLRRELPNERFLYFGDSANAPYGTRPTEQIRELTLAAAEKLMVRGCKALVVACNTATAAAIEDLRRQYPDKIVIGIEPALKIASDRYPGSAVGVMATPATLREEKFARLLHRFADHCQVVKLPAAGLVELVEAGKGNSAETEALLRPLLEPYYGKLSAVVLGCTHYPHVRSMIAKHFSADVKIIDGGEGTARHTKRKLLEAGLLRNTSSESDGKIEIINTSQDEKMIEISKKLLYR